MRTLLIIEIDEKLLTSDYALLRSIHRALRDCLFLAYPLPKWRVMWQTDGRAKQSTRAHSPSEEGYW